MATYTVSAFSMDQRRPGRVDASAFGFASGTITINPYSQTRLAIAQITGLFLPSGLLRVAVGPADANFANGVVWDQTNKSIYAWVLSTGAQCAEGLTTIGAINWMAYGQLG
jgi:hypothetical protein